VTAPRKQNAPWIGSPDPLEQARNKAPGIGMPPRRMRRFCVKCQQDKSALGGRLLGTMFLCVDCRKKPGG
jgi:hypothetical protein